MAALLNRLHSKPATSQRSMLRTGLAVSALCAISLTLAGCKSQTVSAGTECRVFGPITYSSRDTVDTQRGVRAHNAAGTAACGWGR
jgi:ABC-type oligopeptide transport system substrate-binding subunit